MPNFAKLQPVTPQPNFGALKPAPPVAPTVKPDSFASLATSAFNGATSLAEKTPMAPLGNAIGSSLYDIGSIGSKLFSGDLAGAAQEGPQDVAAMNSQMEPTVGSAVESAAIPASLAVGGEGSLAARLGSSAGANAVIGGANSMSQGGSAGDVAENTILGGLIGGVGQTGGEALNALQKVLPSRLVQGALSKLKPGNVDYALDHTQLGSIQSMLSGSKDAITDYAGQIKGLLSSPSYANALGDGSKAIENTLGQFKDSIVQTPADVAKALKQVAPGAAQIVDKVVNGSATLAEKNTLRSAIDSNVYKNHNDLPTLTFAKEVANSVANSLRNEVQTHAPETASVFSDFSKELNLQKALAKAQVGIQNSGKVGLKDIISYLSGGLPAVLGERFAQSPGVTLATAKGVRGLGAAMPTLNAIGRAAKTTATTGATQ